MESSGVSFRRSVSEDWSDIWPIFHVVVASGDTYAFPVGTSESDARTIWMQPGTDRRYTYVAELGGQVVATAYLKPNALGAGDHICNAGWMVPPQASGQGIGRIFAEFVIDEARTLGYLGMQFNAVVASNTRAVRLWQSMGFEIVGTVPDAFRHPTRGLTPAHVMYRKL
jgi:L-amino acid N-acyltransferase YncA